MAKVDKARRSADKTRDAPLELKLTGSQINLQERPRSNHALSRYSSRSSLNNLKRPVSATPHLGYYQQNTMRKLVNWSRPQSAEASTIGIGRNSKLAANFRQSVACLDEHDFGLYSGSNHLSSDSDSDLVSAYNRRKPCGGAGPSGGGDTRNNPSFSNRGLHTATDPNRGHHPDPAMDVVNISDEENLDDIVALKFQRWFPSSRTDKASMILERKETTTDSNGTVYHASKFELRNYSNTESVVNVLNDIDDEELLRDDEPPRPKSSKERIPQEHDVAKRSCTSRQESRTISSIRESESYHNGLENRTLDRQNQPVENQKNGLRSPYPSLSKNDSNNNAKQSGESYGSYSLLNPVAAKYPNKMNYESVSELIDGTLHKIGFYSPPQASKTENPSSRPQTGNGQEDKSPKNHFSSTSSFLFNAANSKRFDSFPEVADKFDKDACQSSNVSSCGTDKVMSSSGYSTGKTSSDVYSQPSNSKTDSPVPNCTQNELDLTGKTESDQMEQSASFRTTQVKQDRVLEARSAALREAERKISESKCAEDKYIPTVYPIQYSTKVQTLSTVVINGGPIRTTSKELRENGTSFEPEHKVRFETDDRDKNPESRSSSFPSDSVKLGTNIQNILSNEKIEEVTKFVIDGHYSNEIFYSVNRQIDPLKKFDSAEESRHVCMSSELPTHRFEGEGPRQRPATSGVSDFNTWTSTRIESEGMIDKTRDQSNSTNSRVGSSKPQDDVKKSLPYMELMDVIKAIEEDEKETSKYGAGDNATTSKKSSSSDIWTLLDEIDGKTFDKGAVDHSTPKSGTKPRPTRMNDLICLSNAELAQKVMTLSLQVEDMEVTLETSAKRLRDMQQSLKKQKEESEAAIKRHQKFIDQLLKEKLTLTNQCTKIIGEMEKQYDVTLKNLEGKYKVEMKKQEERHLAAEKLRKDKWIDAKTQRIKDMTVKSLEPELNRMANQHQEELAEMKKIYQKQLEQQEEMCNRRMNALREKMETEKENALTLEKEAARNKLENELQELERRYQDQRKKLIADLHAERESMEREKDSVLLERERELERRFAQREKELEKSWTEKEKLATEKLAAIEANYKCEIKRIKAAADEEKERWREVELAKLNEKEKLMREQCKRERDRHIESVIEKLERETSEKEQAIENKLKRLKEQLERESEEHEQTTDTLRKKLTETRNETRDKEEQLSQLKSQLSRVESENNMLKELCDRLSKDQVEVRNSASNELSNHISKLKKELVQMRLNHEAEIAALKGEKEWESTQVCNRVLETVARKDERISQLQKDLAAALSRCSHLERISEEQYGSHS
nr:PREDICTED: titin homolog [Bemisia tabaci]